MYAGMNALFCGPISIYFIPSPKKKLFGTELYNAVDLVTESDNQLVFKYRKYSYLYYSKTRSRTFHTLKKKPCYSKSVWHDKFGLRFSV